MSDPCSCPCCTWICFQETPPLPWGDQDLLLLPRVGTTEKWEVTIQLKKGKRLLDMGGLHPVPSHPGGKEVRLMRHKQELLSSAHGFPGSPRS